MRVMVKIRPGLMYFMCTFCMFFYIFVCIIIKQLLFYLSFYTLMTMLVVYRPFCNINLIWFNLHINIYKVATTISKLLIEWYDAAEIFMQWYSALDFLLTYTTVLTCFYVYYHVYMLLMYKTCQQECCIYQLRWFQQRHLHVRPGLRHDTGTGRHHQLSLM